MAFTGYDLRPIGKHEPKGPLLFNSGFGSDVANAPTLIKKCVPNGKRTHRVPSSRRRNWRIHIQKFTPTSRPPIQNLGCLSPKSPPPLHLSAQLHFRHPPPF